ncbi:N-acetylmuramoyl-L-alanine amidase family protein [Paenibacillus piri]|uniref:AMIN domain-containing protein n=1 Tax=Paenibacillus piri TaxID=2547395 RepID=A0A4R5KWN3_9BACL|nr:N-acetylmuramoyl-L-alanine amidase family protein [Paenibacillus piri]TDF99390.1 AMIN domain-containing protein [Paenibacillus piri]
MRILTTMIFMLLVSLLAVPLMAFAAEQPIHLFLNGKALAAEVAPKIVQGNTVVPVRVIAESLGSKVQWEEKSRKVTVAKDDINIQLFINKQEVTVNNKRFQLETAPAIMDGSTMLPLRFVSEQFGVKVTWDEPTRSVFLFQETDMSDDEADLAAELEGEAVDGKAAASDKEGRPVDGKPAADKDQGKAGDKSGDKEPAKTSDKTADKDAGNTTNKTTDKDAGKTADKPGAAGAAPLPGDAAGKDKPCDKNAVSGQQPPAGQPGQGQQGQLGQPVQSGQAVQPGQTNPNSPANCKAAEAATTVQSIVLDGDQLIVKASGAKAVPNVSYTDEPKRIVIEIPDAQLDPALKLGANGEGVSKDKSQTVSQIRYLLFSKESTNVRIIIDLSKKIDLKPSNASSPTQLVWSLIAPKDRYRVVIDPGHGGKDTGAISITKRLEKDFVLALSTKVHKLLEKEPKIEALLTRKDDTFVELSDRADYANDRQADLFVAIHGNSAGKETVRGVETYYYTEQSASFAALMHKQLLKSTGFPDRKVKQSGFYVVKNTTMPSLLLEVGFLSNQTDESTMFQDAFQNQVAASIVAAIKQQLNID